MSSRSQVIGQQITADSPYVQPETDDVILLAVLVDKSYSMSDGTKTAGVLQGQPAMLDAFEGSSRRTRAKLRICQALFDSSTTVLHGFKVLNDPGVVRLVQTNYLADGSRTALRDTLVGAVSATQKARSDYENDNYDVTAMIAVLTDGLDNTSQLSVSDTKRAVIDFTTNPKNRVLYIGIGSEDHMSSALELGVEGKDVLTVASSAQEIRKAFELVSSKSMGMQG